jgi:hypothetical protein
MRAPCAHPTGQPVSYQRLKRIHHHRTETQDGIEETAISELLFPAEAHVAMGYYFDHQAEIDAEIQQELSAVDDARRKLPDTPFVARLRAQGRL